ncbi:MAG TPA: oligosaccharide flippase family protein [Pyrinomonadaceae bacterium]|nr:oligosaccharide flippase family protein [Pyrinomonadaceae bacterium]
MSTDAIKDGGRSLTASAAWVMAAKTLAFAFAFALPLLLVRRLDQTEFGLYKQVFLLVDVAVSILPLGFGMSAFYFLPREPERQGQIVFNILLFHFFVGLLVWLLFVARPELTATLLNSPQLTALAPLIGLAILFWISSYFLETVAVAHQELRLASVFIVGARLTKSVFFISAALFWPDVRTLIYAAIVQGALQTVVLVFYLRSRFGAFWRGFEWAMLRAQLAYALPLGLAAVVLLLFGYLDNFFVSHRFDPATYAVYAVGCFNIPLIGILSEAVGQVLIPRVSFLQKQDARREILEVTARMMRKLAFVFLPIYVLLLVVAREFIMLLFTEQYLAAWPIFAINLTLIPLGILASACDPVMRAYAEHRYFMLKLRVVLLFVFMGAVWFGVSRFGMVGAITAAVLVNLVERAATARKVGRILGVKWGDAPLLRDVGKLAAAAGAAGIVTAIVRSFLAGQRPFWLLVACGAIFSATYLALVLLLKIPTRGERASFQQNLARWQHRTPWRRAVNPLT